LCVTVRLCSQWLEIVQQLNIFMKFDFFIY